MPVDRWLLAVLLALSAAPAAAQAPPVASVRLTLDEAVAEALAGNASLRAARSGVEEAAAFVSVTSSGWFPRVSFSEGWQRGNQPVFVFSSLLAARRFAAGNLALESLNRPAPLAVFHATAGIEQLVFDGGRRRAAVASARSSRDIAQSSLDRASAALVVSVTQAYGRVLEADAAARAANANLASLGEDLARTERRRDAGVVSDADVLALSVRVSDLRERVIRAESGSATARAELNRLTGAPIDRDIQVVEPPAPIDDAATLADLKTLLAEAESTRPELRGADAAEAAADAARRQARGAIVPSVAVQGVVDLVGTTVTDRRSSWLVGGELRWSVSTGGAERAATRAAAAGVARARAEREDVRAAVDVDVLTAVRRWQEAVARRDVGRAAVADAAERQRIVRDRFDVGLAGVTDVLAASAAVLEAEANRTSAAVDLIVRRAELHRALGRAR